jgi:predicted PurR-regulated permease PerM
MNTERFQLNFFLGLLVGVLIFTAIIFLPFLAPIALSIMFAVVLKPVQKFFLKLWKGYATPASFSTVFFLIIAILVPMVFLGFKVFDESYRFYFDIRDKGFGDLNASIGHFTQVIQAYYPDFSFDSAKYLNNFSNWFVSNLGAIFSNTTNLAMNIILGIVSLFYVLRDGHKLKSEIIKLSPLADKYDEEIATRLETAVNSVVIGSLFTAIVQGLCLGIGFVFFGIPHAVLWGTIAAMIALLPAGTTIVLVPGALYLLAIGNIPGAIGIIVWGVLLVGTVDNILKPLLIHKKSKAHAFLILLAVLGGLVYFGLVGIFLGPLVIAFLLALIDIYKLLILDDTKKKVTAL